MKCIVKGNKNSGHIIQIIAYHNRALEVVTKARKVVEDCTDTDIKIEKP
jgi:hypothetical protein